MCVCVCVYFGTLQEPAWNKSLGNTIRCVLCAMASSFPISQHIRNTCAPSMAWASSPDWGHYVAHAWNGFIPLHSHDMLGLWTWTWTRNSKCNEWQMQIRFSAPSCRFLLISPLINNDEVSYCQHANTAVRVIFYIFLILVKYIFFSGFKFPISCRTRRHCISNCLKRKH